MSVLLLEAVRVQDVDQYGEPVGEVRNEIRRMLLFETGEEATTFVIKDIANGSGLLDEDGEPQRGWVVLEPHEVLLSLRAGVPVHQQNVGGEDEEQPPSPIVPPYDADDPPGWSGAEPE